MLAATPPLHYTPKHTQKFIYQGKITVEKMRKRLFIAFNEIFV